MCEQLMQKTKTAVREAVLTGQPRGVIGNHLNGYAIVSEAGNCQAIPRIVVHPCNSTESIDDQIDALCMASVSPREAIRLAHLIGYQVAQNEMAQVLGELQVTQLDNIDDAGMLIIPKVEIEP